MTDVTENDTSKLWSYNRLADGFEIDRGTVKRKLTAAGIEPSGLTFNGYPAFRLKDAAAALVVPVGRNCNPEKLDPRARLDWYKGEIERLRLGEKQRVLIPADEVEEEMVMLAKTVIAALETLPDLLERDAGLSGDQVDLVEATVNNLREEIYRQLSEDEPITQPPESNDIEQEPCIERAATQPA